MLFYLIGWLHVFLAPYTKVEESFNLHATHDLIFYGPLPSSLPNYDHFVFPGVVPRSFIGSLSLSIAAGLAGILAKAIHLLHSKSDVQLLVRLTLSTINALGLVQLRRAVRRRFGMKTSTMFILLTCTQFHIPFWMGRTLPNMFALYPVNVAYSYIVAKHTTPAERQKSYHAAIITLIFAAVTLRSELILLLGPIVLQALYLRYTNLFAVIKLGVVSGALSLVSTVIIDSYFWDRWPLWPELAGLYFNVYEGKSSDWGISPAYSYFAVHLPKLLMSTLPLSAVGLASDPRMRTLLFPCVAFVAFLSCLGHKEWRFVVYVVPIWNIAGARGAASLLSAHITSKNAFISHGFKVILLGLFGLNIITTVLLTEASMVNYPGGEALSRLNTLIERTEFPRTEWTVHIDNFAAQTGASLFLHEHAPPDGYIATASTLNVKYNKTENLAAPDDFQGFDWIITESADVFLGGHGAETASQWRVGGRVDGLHGVKLRPLGEGGVWKRIRVPTVVQEPKLWLLRRDYH